MQVISKKVSKQLNQLIVFTIKWDKIYYIERKRLEITAGKVITTSITG